MGVTAHPARSRCDLPGDDAPSAPPGVLVPDSAAATDGPASTDRAYREFYDDAPQERLRQTASDYLSRNALVPDSSPSESATSPPTSRTSSAETSRTSAPSPTSRRCSSSPSGPANPSPSSAP